MKTITFTDEQIGHLMWALGAATAHAENGGQKEVTAALIDLANHINRSATNNETPRN